LIGRQLHVVPFLVATQFEHTEAKPDTKPTKRTNLLNGRKRQEPPPAEKGRVFLMHPILINAFGFSIHSYGVLLAIGFMVGISLAAKEAVRTGVDPEKVLNLTFWILVSSIAGSRIFHCLVF
jgi:hypothetical protein